MLGNGIYNLAQPAILQSYDRDRFACVERFAKQGLKHIKHAIDCWINPEACKYIY
jgi:hypothetical protein